MAVSGLVGGALASFAGYRLGSATADVPSPTSRLFYSGRVSNGAAPLTGNHVVKAEFFPAPTGGAAVCSPPAVNTNPLDGTFTVDTSMCDASFKAASSVFVQLTIDPSNNPTMVPSPGMARPQVGAVPFAVQSEQAVSAASAQTVTGTLPATQISSGAQTVQQRLDELKLTSAGAREKVIRVRISSDASVLLNDGSIASASIVTTGDFAVNFAAGTFATTPICVCSADGDHRVTCSPHGATASGTRVYTALNGNLNNSTFNLICIGPR